MGILATIGKALTNFFTVREPVKPTRRQGVGGAMSVGGFLVQQERSPDLASPITRYRAFNEMVLNNTTVGASVWLFLRTIIHPDWESKPAEEGNAEAERIAELWEDVINDMRIPFFEVVRTTALFKLYGFVVQERIAKKRDDGVIGFDSIEHRPQFTIEQWDIDDDGLVQGFGQRDPTNGTMHYIPRAKCIYVRDSSITSYPDGVGMLRLAFEANRTHKRFEQLEGWMYELDARGMPVGYAPLGALDDAVTDNKLTAAQRTARIKPIKDIVKNHVKNPGLGLVLDSAVYRDNGPTQSPSGTPMYKLELLRGDSGDSAGMDTAIKRKTFELARIFNTAHLLLGGDGKGSLALSRDAREIFVDSVRSCLKEIHAYYDDDLLDDWMETNGFDKELKPKFAPNRLQLQALGEFVDNAVKMYQAGAYMPPDDPIWAQARGMMDAAEPMEVSPEVAGQLMLGPMAHMQEFDEDGNPLPPDPNASPSPFGGGEEEEGEEVDDEGTEPEQPDAKDVERDEDPKKKPKPGKKPAPPKKRRWFGRR